MFWSVIGAVAGAALWMLFQISATLNRIETELRSISSATRALDTELGSISSSLQSIDTEAGLIRIGMGLKK